MHIKKVFASAAFLLAIGLSGTAFSQILGRPGQPTGPVFGQSMFTTNPDAAVFDPGNLDYDMQPFAPLDISEFDGPQGPHSGFYASYPKDIS